MAALRKAFDEAVKSPDYLRETVDKGIEVNAIRGADVQRDVERMINLPKATIDKVKQALEANQAKSK